MVMLDSVFASRVVNVLFCIRGVLQWNEIMVLLMVRMLICGFMG